MGNLEGVLVYPAMPAPTLEFVNDDCGGYWEITYAGVTKRHRQEWQAWWLYEMARAAYCVTNAATALPSSDKPAPADPKD